MLTSWRRKSCQHLHKIPVAYNYCSAKKQVTDQGGKITHEFKLIKGFTYASNLTIGASRSTYVLTRLMTARTCQTTRCRRCSRTSISTLRLMERSPRNDAVLMMYERMLHVEFWLDDIDGYRWINATSTASIASTIRAAQAGLFTNSAGGLPAS